MTKASLAKTAAPAPSDVGLQKKKSRTDRQTDIVALKTEAVIINKMKELQLAFYCAAPRCRMINQKKTKNINSYQHCSKVRYSKTFLEFITCSKLYSSWNWEYLTNGDIFTH